MKGLIALIGIIASCIGIYVFVSGHQSLDQATGDWTVPRLPPLTLTSPKIKTTVGWQEMASWLPDEDTKVYTSTARYGTPNKEIAKDYDDPSAEFKRLNDLGRVTGYTKDFDKGCGYTGDDIGGMSYGISVFETASGADSFLKQWYENVGKRNRGTRSLDKSVGDEVAFLLYNYENNCKPAYEMSIAIVRFRKSNVVAEIMIFSRAGTTPTQTLESYALRKAREIELAIDVAAKEMADRGF